jgi:xanthine dehydrogenase YagT iron-sulfur-binding subunit
MKMNDDQRSDESPLPAKHSSEPTTTAQNSERESDLNTKLTRRGFVAGVGALASGVCIGKTFPASATAATLPSSIMPSSEIPNGSIALKVVVNGQPHTLSVDPRVTLLDLLRENLDLTGSKKGCDHGQCGACTVLASGRRINSCLSFAVVHDGERITTVEGLAKGNNLHPMQAAFLEHDGFQCGYCTPGQLCSAVALLDEHKRGDASFVTAELATNSVDLTPDEIRERMSGNICRCGAYPGIVSAIQEVSGERKNVGSKA